MKILYCTFHEIDCGLDLIYDGLCRAIGYENVYEYPTKKSYHSGLIKKYSWYPLFWDWPQIADDSMKLDMLRKGQFDVILFSNRIYQLISTIYKAVIVDIFIELYELILKSGIPLFTLDLNDGVVLTEDLVTLSTGYFKRDYVKDAKYDSKIMPINFCYSPKYIPDDISNDRVNDLFWLGRVYGHRKNYIQACIDVTGVSPNFIPLGRSEIIADQKTYISKLEACKMGLNLWGYGFDDMRCYEIPAHGNLLFGQRVPVVIENNYTDMENAVFFDSIDDMKEKLKFCLDNESFVDEARVKGYEHVLKYHTTEVRARQVLDKICSLIGT